jgi:hypothetical protein
VFHDEAVDGVLHVVSWGHATPRRPAGTTGAAQATREELLAAELEDWTITAHRIASMAVRRERPTWLVIAVTKADLFADDVDAAVRYYSPGSGSPFGDKLDELRALAGGATRCGMAVGDDVDHPVDRLVVEDLVERAEPRGGVVPRDDEEAEAVQLGAAAGPALHHGRAHLGHGVVGGAAGQPVHELALADAGHAGHGHHGIAGPQEPAHPLGSRCECGQQTAGDGRAQSGATRCRQDRPDPG